MISLSGTGTLISKDGLIVTCAHILEEPGQSVMATWPDGSNQAAKVLGMCPDLDIALVRIVLTVLRDVEHYLLRATMVARSQD